MRMRRETAAFWVLFCQTPTATLDPLPNPDDEQVTGDPALEALFAWDEDGPAIRTMGAL